MCRDLSAEYFGDPTPSMDNTKWAIESVETNAEARGQFDDFKAEIRNPKSEVRNAK